MASSLKFAKQVPWVTVSSVLTKHNFLVMLVILQGVGHNDDKVLVLAATNTPYALDQVENIYQFFIKLHHASFL